MSDLEDEKFNEVDQTVLKNSSVLLSNDNPSKTTHEATTSPVVLESHELGAA